MCRMEKCVGKKRLLFVGALLVVIGVVFVKVEFNLTYDREGLYLLKGVNGAWLEITDDLFPEDTDRLINSYVFSGFKHVVTQSGCTATGSPCMDFEWNTTSGRGFIKTKYPDGKKLLICLSRFKDDNGKYVSGLFLGGNLPPSDPDAEIFNKNESGMAYFDGTRYFHIWCNVNEGFFDDSNKLIEPANWTFIDSKVLENSPTDLTLLSRHQVQINNVPVTFERYLFYEAGNTYVTLVTTFKNIGKTNTAFSYMYGDEPWVGNYGTSAGDIGWLKDRLVKTEMQIDTKHNTYAGIFDYGNDLAGEQNIYTNQANFIEWQQTDPPDLAYFSNQFGKFGKQEDKIPLSSHTNRVIALHWGKFILQPGQSYTFKIAVGMATNNPQTKLPVKPDTGLN